MTGEPTGRDCTGPGLADLTGPADVSGPEESLVERLGRLEATLSQAVTEDRSALQNELNAVCEAMGAMVGAGDSTGITELDEAGFTGWADRATAQDWAGLVAWVDWLSVTYALGDLGVRACWPAHGAAVEELGALKMAWEHAIGACVENEWVGTEALAYWHDRYLPGTVQRLQTVHGLKVCKQRHEQRPRPVLTDTSLAVVRSTGQVPDLAVSHG